MTCTFHYSQTGSAAAAAPLRGKGAGPPVTYVVWPHESPAAAAAATAVSVVFCYAALSVLTSQWLKLVTPNEPPRFFLTKTHRPESAAYLLTPRYDWGASD